jgi:hypothetical protein
MKDIMKNGKVWLLLKEKMNGWKKFIIVEETKQRLNCSYGWNFQNYLYTLRNAPELHGWGNFKEKFKNLLENIQELIIKKYMVALRCGVYNIDH